MPFTGGWWDATNVSSGATTYYTADDANASITSNLQLFQGSEVFVSATGPGANLSLGLQSPILLAPVVGQEYDTTSNLGAYSGNSGCSGSWIYDAYSGPYPIPLQNSPIALLGVEFDLDCTGGGVPETEYTGQIAVNLPNDGGQGYYVYDQYGALYGFGNNNYLTYFGDLSSFNLNAPIVSMAVEPDGGGYWMLGSDGGIFSFGDAQFYGSTGGIALNKPVVSMTSTADGRGYWFVASDGGIFAFGDAAFYGSMGGQPLNKPIVGMAATPDGRGYWEVASDGGIFAFGDAHFYGSTGVIHLNKPIVGMTATPDGQGYWFVATDGGIFSFGDAQFYGSTGNLTLVEPIVGMTATPDGNGYWMIAADGGIFSFGDAPFAGSLAGQGDQEVAGVAIT
jgi:ribosomal protein L24E